MGRNYQRDFFRSETVANAVTTNLWSERWIGAEGEAFALGVGVQDPNNWATTTFSLKINGVPVLDYGKIQDRIGSPDMMTPVDIYLPPYALIEFEVTNGAAAPDLFFGRLVCRTLR